VRRGDVWWAEREPDRRRPVLVLTRDQAIPVLHSVVVAPATRTIRGIPSEVVVGPDDGMPAESAFSFDNLTLVPKSMLSERVCELGPQRMWEACQAMRDAFDC
jgi:mRNA interferase MazF